jgi:hypothetical protein
MFKKPGIALSETTLENKNNYNALSDVGSHCFESSQMTSSKLGAE